LCWGVDYEIARFKFRFSLLVSGDSLRSITIGRYQLSLLLLIIVAIACPIVLAATYLWTVRTIPFSVEEPLSITDYPAAFHVHPGENKTLDITIQNLATVDYSVTLVFELNDTVYQQSYVTTSNYTYTVMPSTNNITAWIFVEKKAPSADLELQIDFYRE
jgi:hypothetical protein